MVNMSKVHNLQLTNPSMVKGEDLKHPKMEKRKERRKTEGTTEGVNNLKMALRPMSRKRTKKQVR